MLCEALSGVSMKKYLTSKESVELFERSLVKKVLQAVWE